MTLKTTLVAFLTIFLWASAFVAIRAGLTTYSPEGMALLRYLIASFSMAIIYFRLPARQKISRRDLYGLLFVGAFGIGFYNITLNYGEVTISSGIASFIISQAPILTALIAVLFLKEKMSLLRGLGFFVSLLGVTLIAFAETNESSALDLGLFYLLCATFAGSCYSLMQKPFLKKYHPVEVAAFAIWGGTLFLLFYFPQLKIDISKASWQDTGLIVYLGLFPGTIAYLAWCYVLAEISAVRAGSFLYYLPFFTILLGWLFLGELPLLLALIGGVVAILGVWLVNYSYRLQIIRQPITSARNIAPPDENK